jgi:DNA-binding MarR family transcriptional regulator/GNAT superfamily N-acetyltransferase
MKNDFVKELDFLGFVTRLKRISDAMLHDGRRLYKELGIDIEPNWFVILKLLKKEGEMPITEIANRIGFAHPSIISIVNKMTKAGYLKSKKCSDDSRKRLIMLTPKAKEKIPEFERIWSAGTASVKKMLDDIDALDFLEKLEQRIGERGFKQRTLEELKKQGEVRISEFQDKYAKDFARLNYEWIEEQYEVEEHDREQLDSPREYIIDHGGQIFSAVLGGEVVGTVALIYMDEETFELAKMAVTSNYRGLNIGGKLMQACIDFSKSVGKKRILLESNTKQIPAIRLYRKFGFQEIPLDPNSPFERANIRMKLVL